MGTVPQGSFSSQFWKSIKILNHIRKKSKHKTYFSIYDCLRNPSISLLMTQDRIKYNDAYLFFFRNAVHH